MNKKKIFVYFIISLLFFTTCKNINNFFKKKDKIIVLIDNKYSETFEGKKLSREILNSFLKEQKLDYKIIKTIQSDIINSIPDKKNHIGVTNLEYDSINKKVKSGHISKALFSDALYFIYREKYNFKYPNSLYYEKTGIIYESKQYNFILNKFGNRNNFYVYNNINNMLIDFDRNKTDIIIISRNDYYKNILLLPAIEADFFNLGKPYGHIIFSDINIKSKFDSFIDNNYNKYDWSYILYKKPKKITFIEKYFK